MSEQQNTPESAISDSLISQISKLRERMLRVHYYEESHWLAAAVSFPALCHSPLGQDALRRAATIAWQFGFPAVSHWINDTVLAEVAAETRKEDGAPAADRPVRIPPAPDFA